MRGARAGWLGWLAGAIVVMLLVMCLAPAVADLRWGMTHHGRVSTGRWTIQVPFGWQSVADEDGHGGEDEALVLRRSRWSWFWGRSVDEVSVREARGSFDAVELAQRWDRTETQMMIPGDRLEPAPTAAFLREHYRCSDIKRAADGTISFGCFEREGRWAVWYRGQREGVRDVAAMLASATEDGAVTR